MRKLKLSKIFEIACFIIFLLIENLPAQMKVTIILDSLYSQSVAGYKKFNVLLPKDYNINEERYKVIFLLHGYSGNHNDWINKTSLVRYLENYSFIVVTPEADNSWYTNSPVLKNRNYEDYIVKELIPYVEKKYRVISTKHGRAIAGLSMGGFGAIKIALKYPNMFQFAGSFSGAFNWAELLNRDGGQLSQSLKDAFGAKKSEHWDKNDVFALSDSVKHLELPYFYISCGKDDRVEGLLESNRKLIEKFQRNGMVYEYHELPGGHSWIFWDREIKNFLKVLSEKW
ncbi:MAG: alpha/beta hydrolase family protein [Candidatus Kryptonium sp.]|nr:esterase family protein [Candidatus Kryptonium sp.]MDW8109357.1 alpha/beta hydrolase family protein [Candidatus Kryptonium sp.]